MVKGLPKIRITIFALVFISLMIALPMTIRSVVAEGPSGNSYSYETFVNNGCQFGPDYPMYGECEHSHLSYSDDMMVGLGLYTYYDTSNQYYYDYGSWWFSTQAGNSQSTTDNSPVHSMPPMDRVYDLDYGLSTAYHSDYYDYDSGTWTNGYYFNGNWCSLGGYYASVVSYQSYWSFGDHVSAEGMTVGAFYYNSNPNTVDYYYAQTQVPPGHSIPSGISPYAFLTAHPYSDGGDW